MFIQLNEFNYCWFYFDGCLFSNLFYEIKCDIILQEEKLSFLTCPVIMELISVVWCFFTENRKACFSCGKKSSFNEPLTIVT